MSEIILQLDAYEQNMLEKYAEKKGLSLSDTIKNVFFDSIEDEMDFQRIIEHRARKARGEVKMYSLDEIEAELGLNDV